MVLTSLVLASVSLLVSVTLWMLPRVDLERTKLRRAFEALEGEFDDLKDSVRSSVGRISRLKRSMIESAQPGGEPDDVPDASEDDVQPRLTPRQLQINSKILARRNRSMS